MNIMGNYAPCTIELGQKQTQCCHQPGLCRHKYKKTFLVEHTQCPCPLWWA
ncbi:unnamed protein product, partial [Ectocarpus fasciculatus]